MSATSALLAELAQANDGFLASKYLSVACFCLLLYDYVTCLDQEMEFFWDTEWSVTRVLYFLNRYIPPWVFAMQLLYLFQEDLSLEAIKATTTFEVLGMLVVEVVLVIRVYHLWAHNRVVQLCLCLCFSVAMSVAVAYAGLAVHNLSAGRLPPPLEPGCLNEGKGLYWPIFLPAILVQTLLFALTLLRVLRPMSNGRNKSIVKRLLRDGCFFYLVVCMSVAISGSGSLDLSNPRYAVPALASNSLLAVHSICASHLILSIHSLAADMGSEPIFILSSIEISRVAWRKGASRNELYVDMRSDEPVELVNLDPFSGSPISPMKGAVRATRVGVWDTRQGGDADLGFRTYTYER